MLVGTDAGVARQLDLGHKMARTFAAGEAVQRPGVPETNGIILQQTITVLYAPFLQVKIGVSDPDPDMAPYSSPSGSGSVFGIRIRIQALKEPQKLVVTYFFLYTFKRIVKIRWMRPTYLMMFYCSTFYTRIDTILIFLIWTFL